MLPVTMVLLLLIGIDPNYIPWYKEQTQENEYTKPLINKILSMSNNNQIREQDILSLYNRFKNHFVISYNPNNSKAISEYQKDVGNKNLFGREHIFIWLPYASDTGTVQIFDANGSQRHQTITISRGL
jgi:hypothetical protein